VSGVAIVRYLVADTDVAVGFYTEHLGFRLEQRMGPAFAIVERDGLELWLSGPQTSAAQPMPDGRMREPGGWNRLVVEGGTQVLVEDPSGNPVELFSPR
jgi:catechol 2,3-dioxygenase-like lactoylglutathione lyase family enzyme